MYRYGRQGSVWLRDQPVAKVRDWNVTSSVSLLETTKVDAIAPTFRPGLKDSSGSATLLYYRLDPREKGLRREFGELISRVHRVGRLDGDPPLRLELRVSNRPGDRIVCDVWITSAEFGTAAGELAEVPIDFQVNGDLKEAIR